MPAFTPGETEPLLVSPAVHHGATATMAAAPLIVAPPGCCCESPTCGVRVSPTTTAGDAADASGRTAAEHSAAMGHTTPEEAARARKAKRSLFIALTLCAGFMGVEAYAGLRSHSLAILTDAAHMLTDVASIALAIFAVIASQWAPSESFTFGYKRAEVVGALFSIVLVWGLVAGILIEAGMRIYTFCHCAMGTQSPFTQCEGINPRIMLIIGGCGLVSNVTIGVVLWWGGAEVQHAHSHGEGGCCCGGGAQHGHAHDHSHGHDADSDDDDFTDHGHCHGHGTGAGCGCCHGHNCSGGGGGSHHGHSHGPYGHSRRSGASSRNNSHGDSHASGAVDRRQQQQQQHGHSHGGSSGGGAGVCTCGHAHGVSHGSSHGQHSHRHGQSAATSRSHDGTMAPTAAGAFSSTSRSELHRRSVRSQSGAAAAGGSNSHGISSHAGSHDGSHDGSHHGHSHNGQPCHGCCHHGHGHGHSVGSDDPHHSHHGQHDHGHSHAHNHGHHDHGHSHADGACCGDHHHGHSHGNMNIRGAAMHALGDCMQSVGVMIASGVIWVGAGAAPHATSWYNLADPLASVFFAALTLWATKGLFVDVLAILMERAPKSVSIPSLRARLGRLPHVIDVGDVHVWSITSDRKAIAAHVLVKEGASSAEVEQLLMAAQMLCRRMGFVVATIQVDYVNLVFGHLLPQQVVALRAPPPLVEPQPQFMQLQEPHTHPSGTSAVGGFHSLRSHGSHREDAVV